MHVQFYFSHEVMTIDYYDLFNTHTHAHTHTPVPVCSRAVRGAAAQEVGWLRPQWPYVFVGWSQMKCLWWPRQPQTVGGGKCVMHWSPYKQSTLYNTARLMGLKVSIACVWTCASWLPLYYASRHRPIMVKLTVLIQTLLVWLSINKSHCNTHTPVETDWLNSGETLQTLGDSPT